MKIGKREFDIENRTYVMGILNITPDSFLDGGRYQILDAALRRADQMIKEGVDIIDIGGESTRPGSDYVKAEEEIQRVVPVILALKQEFDIPLSLDTYKGSVARAGIAAGVDLINDIWGLKYEEDMAKAIAEHDIPCCLMHNRKVAEYQDFIPDLMDDLKETLDIAAQAGIQKEHIILDPGVGFGKTHEQNLLVIKKLEEFHRFGLPLLLGTSRKSVIGLTLDVPTGERLAGTLATTVLAVQKQCTFVRVHDVKEHVQVIKMVQMIQNA